MSSMHHPTAQITPASDQAAVTASARVREDDVALIAALRARRPNALATFARRYRSLILAAARQHLRDERDLEEVVQDVYWTVYRRIELFRGDSSFSTWVYRVAHNAALMAVRRHKRAATPMADAALEPLLEASHAGVSDHMPDAQAHGRRALFNLLQAMQDLPEAQLALFVATDLEYRDRQDIADQLGLSMSALKARIFRVRTQLRDAMVADTSWRGIAPSFLAAAR